MELDKEKQQKAIELSRKLAKKYDPIETEVFLEDHKDESWYDDFILLYKMITDRNFKLSGKTKLAIAGALAYLVSPLDIIPDLIPVIGWIDDIFVLNFVKNSIKNDIDRYKKYLESKNDETRE